jgi:multiple sugar transport system substrate-binding protein
VQQNATRPDRRLGRRAVLVAATATIAAHTLPTRAANTFDWQRFKGQHIEVALQRTAFADYLKQHEKDFTALTGITVGSEQIPEQQFRQKLVIELSSGNPSMDVCYIAYTSQKRLIGNGHWLLDLRPFLADPAMTAPDFDFADFTPAAVAYATQQDGRLDTIPITFHYNLLMWNKELLAAKGLAPPDSFPALLDAARKLHDPKAGVSGFVARGLKNANTPVWTSFLLGYGLDAIDGDGQFHTDGPEAIEAATLYQTLDRECGPIGVVGFNWYECQADFMMGRSAMFLDTESVGGIASDPAKSRIAAKVGYAMMPAGPKTRVAPMFGDGIGIAAASKKQGAAWLYCQWATSKTSQAQQMAGGSGAPTRGSAYDMVKTMPDRAIPDEWIAAVTASSRIAHPCIPEIVAANEFRDVFGVALSNMLTGADPAEQLRHATESFRGVFAKSG